MEFDESELKDELIQFLDTEDSLDVSKELITGVDWDDESFETTQQNTQTATNTSDMTQTEQSWDRALRQLCERLSQEHQSNSRHQQNKDSTLDAISKMFDQAHVTLSEPKGRQAKKSENANQSEILDDVNRGNTSESRDKQDEESLDWERFYDHLKKKVEGDTQQLTTCTSSLLSNMMSLVSHTKQQMASMNYSRQEGETENPSTSAMHKPEENVVLSKRPNSGQFRNRKVEDAPNPAQKKKLEENGSSPATLDKAMERAMTSKETNPKKKREIEDGDTHKKSLSATSTFANSTTSASPQKKSTLEDVERRKKSNTTKRGHKEKEENSDGSNAAQSRRKKNKTHEIEYAEESGDEFKKPLPTAVPKTPTTTKKKIPRTDGKRKLSLNKSTPSVKKSHAKKVRNLNKLLAFSSDDSSDDGRQPIKQQKRSMKAFDFFSASKPMEGLPKTSTPKTEKTALSKTARKKMADEHKPKASKRKLDTQALSNDSSSGGKTRSIGKDKTAPGSTRNIKSKVVATKYINKDITDFFQKCSFKHDANGRSNDKNASPKNTADVKKWMEKCNPLPVDLLFDDLGEDDELVLVQAPKAFQVKQLNKTQTGRAVDYCYCGEDGLTYSTHRHIRNLPFKWKIFESKIKQPMQYSAFLPDKVENVHAVPFTSLMTVRKEFQS